MLEWMPADIQKRYGERGYSAVSGDSLSLDPATAPQIVEALEMHGYRCVRDDDLISLASWR
jgi:hypothetical protein